MSDVRLVEPWDAATPLVGRPITVDIFDGVTDVGNCVRRHDAVGQLVRIEYVVDAFPSATNAWQFPLPIQPNHTQLLHCAAYDTSTTNFRSGAAVADPATMRVQCYFNETAGTGAYVRAGYPWAWAAGDWLRIWGEYWTRNLSTS